MSLTIGKIFYYSLPDIWDRPSHPKIVVAIEDGVIIFVHITKNKKIVKRNCARAEKKWKRPELLTMVHIEGNCYPDIKEEGWINCNSAKDEEEVLIADDGSYGETKSIVSDECLGKIKVGILSSNQVSDKIKRIIRDSLS